MLAGDFIKEEIPGLVELQDLDLLITRIGSALNVAIYKEDEDMRSFVDENFFILRVKNEQINPFYLLAYLQSEMGQKYLSSSYSGATIQRINQKDLLKLEIPLVAEEEQEQIGQKTSEFIQEMDRLQLELEILAEEKIETINSWFKEE